MQKANNFEIRSIKDGSVINQEGTISYPITIHTDQTPWAYNTAIEFDCDNISTYTVEFNITLIKGVLGLLPISHQNDSIVNEELKIEKKGNHTYKIKLKFPFTNIVIRNNEFSKESVCEINNIQIFKEEDIEVDFYKIDLGYKFFLDPDLGKEIIAKERNINVNNVGTLCFLDKEIDIKLDEIFRDDIGKVIIDDFYHRSKLLDIFNYEALSAQLKNAEYGDANYYKTYLKQSIIRVYHLVKSLHKFGVTGGKLLEVGSLLGNFAASLSKLGFDVTVIDRYAEMGDPFQVFVKDLRMKDIRVLETKNDDEYKDIARLEMFDIVIAMAVIEHIPHTPKGFLESLVNKIKPGGLLALDTPNLTRYWHRVNINNDLTVFQNLDKHFNTSIPYGGHHREFTGKELVWMMEEIGCSDVLLKRFDYNLFQFESISGIHKRSLEEIIIDTSKADTILTVGRVNK